MNPVNDASGMLQIVHGSLVSPYTREAFRRAEEERPGACHLELPEDVAGEEVGPTPPPPPPLLPFIVPQNIIFAIHEPDPS